MVVLVFVIGYIDWDIPVEQYPEDTGMHIIKYIVGFLFLINLYFLYKFKPIGKTLFIPLIIIGSIIPVEVDLIMTPGYENLELSFAWIDGVFMGMMIMSLYFTDIKNKFV
tara:strand:+ start:2090 stop:2419 length:330 start_codon:yes stop_codon:yes gene_type:complete